MCVCVCVCVCDCVYVCVDDDDHNDSDNDDNYERDGARGDGHEDIRTSFATSGTPRIAVNGNSELSKLNKEQISRALSLAHHNVACEHRLQSKQWYDCVGGDGR
jgi:hypothetical protein